MFDWPLDIDIFPKEEDKGQTWVKYYERFFLTFFIMHSRKYDEILKKYYE